MKQSLSILFFILCMVSEMALANQCASKFSTSSSVDIILEKLANEGSVTTADINVLRIGVFIDRYDWLSKEEAFQFKKRAEQMGFTDEDIIQMLKNEDFAHNMILFSKRRQIFGLTALKNIGLSNSQIMELNEKSREKYFLSILFRDIHKIQDKKLLLESLGFSEQETFEFLITELSGGGPTPFRFMAIELKKGVAKLSELGMDHSDIRKLLRASGAVDLQLITGMYLFKKNKLTVEQKRDILKQAGLTETAINLIPENMLRITPVHRIITAASVTVVISFWSGVLYYFL